MSYHVVASGNDEPPNMFQEFIDSDDEDEPRYDSEDDVHDPERQEFIKRQDDMHRELAIEATRKILMSTKKYRSGSRKRNKILRELDRGLSVLPPHKWDKLIENSNFFMELLLTDWRKENRKYTENRDAIVQRAREMFLNQLKKLGRSE